MVNELHRLLILNVYVECWDLQTACRFHNVLISYPGKQASYYKYGCCVGQILREFDRFYGENLAFL